jgi:hypothetical protein
MKTVNTIEDAEDLLGNFQEGQTVVLDKDCPNECLVTIIKFGNRFCTVKDNQGQQYQVMIYRLTKN